MADDTNAAETANDTTTTNTEVEQRARLQGWRPKEEFRGSEDRWVDAETFVKRGEDELPIAKERYRNLEDRFVTLERTNQTTLTQLSEATKVMADLRDRGLKAESRAYERARSEIEAEMRQAVNEADQSKFDSAKQKLDKLEVPPAAPAAQTQQTQVAPPAPPTRPEVERWIGDNDWFNRDIGMARYAEAVHVQLMQDKPGMSLAENLKAVREDVVRRFPDKFGNPRRDDPAAVASPSIGGSGSGSKSRAKTYNDLPGDAKLAFERMKRWMPDYKPEEYAKTYFAGEQ